MAVAPTELSPVMMIGWNACRPSSAPSTTSSVSDPARKAVVCSPPRHWLLPIFDSRVQACATLMILHPGPCCEGPISPCLVSSDRISSSGLEWGCLCRPVHVCWFIHVCSGWQNLCVVAFVAPLLLGLVFREVRVGVVPFASHEAPSFVVLVHSLF